MQAQFAEGELQHEANALGGESLPPEFLSDPVTDFGSLVVEIALLQADDADDGAGFSVFNAEVKLLARPHGRAGTLNERDGVVAAVGVGDERESAYLAIPHIFPDTLGIGGFQANQA